MNSPPSEPGAKVPFQTGVEVAKHCCRQFPREILVSIKKDEDQLRQELGSRHLVPPDSWWVDSARHRTYAEEPLRELGPVHALIRRCCGQEASEESDEVVALREEVYRLCNLCRRPRGG